MTHAVLIWIKSGHHFCNNFDYYFSNYPPSEFVNPKPNAIVLMFNFS